MYFTVNIISYIFSKNATPMPNVDIAIPRKIIALAQKSKAPKQFSSLSKYEKYGKLFK